MKKIILPFLFLFPLLLSSQNDRPEKNIVTKRLVSPRQAMGEVPTGSFFSPVPMLIPDAPGGVIVCCTATIQINAFNPGQTLTNVNDFLGMCMVLEHSYYGDLSITLTSPSGQSVELMAYHGAGGTNFGEPNDNHAQANMPGVGYNYCITQSPNNGIFPANANMFYHTYVDPAGNTWNNIPYFSAGNYAPEQPLTNLLGCTLNGDWTLTFCDHQAIDNGYLFNWGLNFDPSIYPPAGVRIPYIQHGGKR